MEKVLELITQSRSVDATRYYFAPRVLNICISLPCPIVNSPTLQHSNHSSTVMILLPGWWSLLLRLYYLFSRILFVILFFFILCSMCVFYSVCATVAVLVTISVLTNLTWFEIRITSKTGTNRRRACWDTNSTRCDGTSRVVSSRMEFGLYWTFFLKYSICGTRCSVYRILGNDVVRQSLTYTSNPKCASCFANQSRRASQRN